MTFVIILDINSFKKYNMSMQNMFLSTQADPPRSDL